MRKWRMFHCWKKWLFSEPLPWRETLLLAILQRFPEICLNTLSPGHDGRHFGRLHFQIQLRQWKCFNVDQYFAELWSNWQWVIIGSGKGLPPKGDKPLHEPMMTQFNEAYLRHPVSMSLKDPRMFITENCIYTQNRMKMLDKKKTITSCLANSSGKYLDT